MRKRFVTVLAALFLVACGNESSVAPAPVAPAPSPHVSRSQELVESIQIDLSAHGLHYSAKENYLVTRDGSGFVLHGSTEGGFMTPKPPGKKVLESIRVSNETVQALVSAADAQPVGRMAGLESLSDEGWLRANADEAYDAMFPEDIRACSTKARDLFKARFQSRDVAVASLNEYYDSRWTDDYPTATVLIKFKDGPEQTIESGAQHALMLPWTAGGRETWSPAISDALVDLLPEESKSRPGFTRSGLVGALADETRRSLGDAWEDLEARCFQKDVIAALESRFTVEKVYLPWGGSFSGYLTSTDMPRNLKIYVVLETDDPAVSKRNAEDFLARVGPYVDLASPYARAHPDINFQLSYREGQSLQPDDLGDGAANKAMAKKSVLLDESGKQMRGRRWVILPTGKVFEWKR